MPGWRTGRTWLFLILAGVALGLAGPFNTFGALGLPARIAFWVAAVLSIGGINFATRHAVARLAGDRLGLWPVLLVTCVVAALPGALLLWVTVPPISGRDPSRCRCPW
jgi:hypothetical protein